jgi:Alcohol dehydrogenase GroES-like domain
LGLAFHHGSVPNFPSIVSVVDINPVVVVALLMLMLSLLSLWDHPLLSASMHITKTVVHASVTIPLIQKAVILETHNTPYVKTGYPVEQPSSFELAAGEWSIELEYSAVCHSDLHICHADWANKSTLPLIGGHEGIGCVVGVGDCVGIKWIGLTCVDNWALMQHWSWCCLYTNFTKTPTHHVICWSLYHMCRVAWAHPQHKSHDLWLILNSMPAQPSMFNHNNHNRYHNNGGIRKIQGNLSKT